MRYRCRILSLARNQKILDGGNPVCSGLIYAEAILIKWLIVEALEAHTTPIRGGTLIA